MEPEALALWRGDDWLVINIGVRIDEQEIHDSLIGNACACWSSCRRSGKLANSSKRSNS